MPDIAESAVVMVVEDESAVAQSIQACLRSAGFEVAKVVASGTDAVASAETVRPDVIVMDIHLRGEMDGISAAERIGATRLTPIVYVTGRSDPETVARAAATNAAGYVLKPFQPRQLVTAVRFAAARGRMVRSSRPDRLENGLRSIASILDDLGATTRFTRPWRQTPRGAALTDRESQIVDLLDDGRRIRSIARALGVTPSTVRNHLKAVFRKLGVHSQAELVEWLRGPAQP